MHNKLNGPKPLLHLTSKSNTTKERITSKLTSLAARNKISVTSSQLRRMIVCIIGVKVKLSTAYHNETNGQTKIMNKYINQRLRPFRSYYQDN